MWLIPPVHREPEPFFFFNSESVHCAGRLTVSIRLPWDAGRRAQLPHVDLESYSLSHGPFQCPSLFQEEPPGDAFACLREAVDGRGCFLASPETGLARNRDSICFCEETAAAGGPDSASPPRKRPLHPVSHTTDPLEDDRWIDWMRMANVLCKSCSTSWPVSPLLSYSSCLNASFSIRTIMFLRK